MHTSANRSPSRSNDSLSVELGGWFKAYATGKGVMAIPIVVAVVAVTALLRLFMG
jgi:hypothetical protein